MDVNDGIAAASDGDRDDEIDGVMLRVPVDVPVCVLVFE